MIKGMASQINSVSGDQYQRTEDKYIANAVKAGVPQEMPSICWIL